MTVRNTGGLTTANARAEILLPPVIHDRRSAIVVGGTCTSGGGRDRVSARRDRRRQLQRDSPVLRSSMSSGSYSDIGRRERRQRNQRQQQPRRRHDQHEPEVDLAVSLQAPASARPARPSTSRCRRPTSPTIDADAVTLTLHLPAGVTAASATLNGSNCTVANGQHHLLVASLAAGATVTGTRDAERKRRR